MFLLLSLLHLSSLLSCSLTPASSFSVCSQWRKWVTAKTLSHTHLVCRLPSNSVSAAWVQPVTLGGKPEVEQERRRRVSSLVAACGVFTHPPFIIHDFFDASSNNDSGLICNYQQTFLSPQQLSPMFPWQHVSCYGHMTIDVSVSDSIFILMHQNKCEKASKVWRTHQQKIRNVFLPQDLWSWLHCKEY